MSYLIAFSLAVFTSIVGIALFRLGEASLLEKETMPPSENQEKTEEPENGVEELVSADASGEQSSLDILYGTEATQKRSVGKKFYMIGMVIFNIALGLFLYGFYQDTYIVIEGLLSIATILWICAWTDRRAFLIPNRVLLVGVLIRCVLLALTALVTPDEFLYDLLRSAIAAVVMFLVALLCRAIMPGAVGFGDIKLLALMGFFLETERTMAAVFFTLIVSFVYSLYLLLTKKANRKTEIPFAPLLLIGTLFATFLTTI